MPTRITALDVSDIRFPTSRNLDGSDAMNPDPDYSAAYCIVETTDGTEGHGLAFTLGRGTELCVQAIESLAPKLVGRSVSGIRSDLGGFWRQLVADSQMRWLGPEKGVVHLAAAAVVNAVWDLLAKEAALPLWRYLAAMTPEEIVRCMIRAPESV